MTRKSKPAKRSSLAGALFSSTQQKLLGLLFGQPGRSFFVTEITALLDSGRGAVQRELARLADGGLIDISRVGNQKHYQANPESPLFDELCSIVRKTVGFEEPLRSAVRSLPGDVALALVYGSVARKTDTSASDIDLLLVADSLTLEKVYSALASAERRLGRSIHPTLYTRDEFQRRRETRNPFLIGVLTGPKVVLAGSVDGE
jgi:predicted nucleotidyltransferase